MVSAFLLGITYISVLDGDHLDFKKRQVTALQKNVKLTTIVTLVIASVEFTLVAGFLAGITQMSIETGDDVYKKLMVLAKVKYMMLISP